MWFYGRPDQLLRGIGLFYLRSSSAHDRDRLEVSVLGSAVMMSDLTGTFATYVIRVSKAVL